MVTILASVATEVPAPAEAAVPFFVVGCPRSGTTLLRLMLDSHSRLAVPGESHFVVGLSARRLRLHNRPEAALEHILAHPRFRVWRLDPDAVRRRVAVERPTTFPALIRVVFAAYARSVGKPRWGDKTPAYVEHIPRLHRLFPDARFIHLIRDGREVAASLAEQDWGTQSAVAGAYWWRRSVAKARRAGARLGPEQYLELRLERLISAPEEVLREVCHFLDEEFEPAMLRYHERAGGRLRRRRRSNRHLHSPPTPGLRDWRRGLSSPRQRAVEAVARRQLSRLGYSTGSPSPAMLVYARLLWLEDLRSRWRVVLRERLRPTTRGTADVNPRM